MLTRLNVCWRMMLSLAVSLGVLGCSGGGSSESGSTTTTPTWAITNQPVDANSQYETVVASATLASVADVVKGMAAEGYIVTASTTRQASDGSGLWVVGTRFKGDATPRPFLAQDGGLDALEAGGYAVVVFAQDFNGGTAGTHFIGER